VNSNIKTLDGQVALVTGSTRGIGKAIALLLAQSGVRVVLNYKKDVSAADRMKQEIKEISKQAPLLCRADVTNPKEFRGMIDQVVESYGRLDILINNADDDQFVFIDPENISEEQWQLIIQGTLHSVYYGCKYAIDVMRKQGGGRIINIAATGDHQSNVTRMCLPYFLAKEGVKTLSRVLAAEEASNQIVINSVSPGFIDNYQYPGDLRQELDRRIPYGRKGTVEEVANVVLFLASPHTSYVTGENINVAGGL
jgi:3-oxoacyl-[acyl-carrier protein] reductase